MTNVLALIKGPERFLLFFDDAPESLAALCRSLGQQAGDPESSLTSTDADFLAFRADEIRRSDDYFPKTSS